LNSAAGAVQKSDKNQAVTLAKNRGFRMDTSYTRFYARAHKRAHIFALGA
jgi:hypothetical protein